MADILNWKPGEGYDIHILRGGSASKPLTTAFNMPANANAATLTFTPGFDSPPGNFGVTVNTATGEVIAGLSPTNSSRVEINNFLITASVQDNANKTYSTEMRVYVHDEIDDIWLTPTKLTIRQELEQDPIHRASGLQGRRDRRYYRLAHDLSKLRSWRQLAVSGRANWHRRNSNGRCCGQERRCQCHSGPSVRITIEHLDDNKRAGSRDHEGQLAERSGDYYSHLHSGIASAKRSKQSAAARHCDA